MCVVEEMSRRRSTDPVDKITISLPRSMRNQLDDRLSFESSRSAWIANAIKLKLTSEEGMKLNDATLEQLVVRALRLCDDHSAEKQMLLTVYDFCRKPENNF